MFLNDLLLHSAAAYIGLGIGICLTVIPIETNEVITILGSYRRKEFHVISSA